jgi:hypothetical protein
VISWFLTAKLVAGKSQDSKPLVVVLIGEIRHLCIVFLGQTSLRGYIDDHENVTLILGHGHVASEHVSIDEFVKGRLEDLGFFAKDRPAGSIAQFGKQHTHGRASSL